METAWAGALLPSPGLHIFAYTSSLAHWPGVQGPSLPRWFKAGSIVLSICFVSWPHCVCESDELALCPVYYQEAVELSVRNSGLGSTNRVQILTHLLICVCDLKRRLTSQAFSFSSGKWV